MAFCMHDEQDCASQQAKKYNIIKTKKDRFQPNESTLWRVLCVHVVDSQ